MEDCIRNTPSSDLETKPELDFIRKRFIKTISYEHRKE